MNRLRYEINSSALENLIVREDGTAVKRFLFSSDFIGFSGHFKGFPILPAIVQILCGLAVAEEMKGKFLELDTIEKAKFLLKLRPDQEIEVHCKASTIRRTEGFSVHLITGEGVAASFSMTCKAEEVQ